MAGKTKEQNKLDALEARVIALETHNGWTPATDVENDDDGDGDGKKPEGDDYRKTE